MPSTDIKKKHLLFASAIHAYDHGIYLTIIALALFVRADFKVSIQMMLLAIAVSHFPYGFGSIGAGILSDRLGPIRALSIGLLIMTAFLLAAALSPHPWVFFGAIFMVGLGGSFNHPTMLTHISQVFHKKRGRSLGMFGLLGNLGQFLPPAGAVGLALLIGWRSVLLVCCGISVILLMGSLRMSRDVFRKEDVEEKKELSYEQAARGLVSGFFMVVLFIALLRGFYMDGAQSILPFYSSEVYMLNAFWGGMLLSFMLVFGMPGHILGGHTADRIGARRAILVSSLFALVALMYLLIPRFDAFLIGLAFIGFAFFFGQASENMLIAEASPSNIRGLTFGLKFVVAFGLGALGPFVIGVALTWYTLEVAYLIIGAFIVATLVSVLLLRYVRSPAARRG